MNIEEQQSTIISYDQTGNSTTTNKLGMREMQAKVYDARDKQYLLIKAPPASGKSRAFMFVALYKLEYQNIKKVIIAVPEKTIGRSFRNTELSKFGFFADWAVSPYYDLCDTENEKEKVHRFVKFLTTNNKSKILVCTHSTLRYGLNEIPDDKLNDVLVGIDEFHHTSADVNNGLGEIVRRLISKTSAHIVAMTGSYFRGDGNPVLRSEDELLFYPVTYNYYDQLNGYKYLKTLGLGYHFYKGHYLSALDKVLDTHKKTLIHIPVTNSKAAGAYDKFDQVKQIEDLCGNVIGCDYNNSIDIIRTKDGRELKIADLVNDDTEHRNRVQHYLQKMKSKDDIDIIIAMGTAKEGFDWEWCEHCLTIGVRGSLTEIVQIIGRCTRDCEGKKHAQFTNLIAAPDETQDDVVVAVNDMLKAITASLLMEQVMAPSWNFKTSKDADDENADGRTLIIEGLKPLSSAHTKQIVEEQLDDLKANILQHPSIAEAIQVGTSPEVINKVLIPKIVEEIHPELTADENEEISQRVVLDFVAKGKDVVETSEGNKLLKLTNSFININELSISLINSINPFQRAYEIMSKEIDAPVLKVIQDTIAEKNIDMTIEEAIELYKGPFQEYRGKYGDHPSINDPNVDVRRLAQAIKVIKNYKIRKEMGLDYIPGIMMKGDK